MFAVIYRFAPLSRMDWRAAFLGAVPAGIALQAIPWLIGLYFDAAAGFAAVRLFLLLAVLLLGLYTMALVMLFGAGFAVKAETPARGSRGSGGGARDEARRRQHRAREPVDGRAGEHRVLRRRAEHELTLPERGARRGRRPGARRARRRRSSR